MTRLEWERSSHYLRELLKEFRERDHVTRSGIIKYKFAMEYNEQRGMFHLWNGVSRNTMATFKIGRNLVVRYRPASFYKNEIFKFELPDKKPVFVPSDNLSNSRSLINGRVQRGVERAMAELNLESQRDTAFTVRYSTPKIDVMGRVNNITIDVRYINQADIDIHDPVVRRQLNFLVQNDFIQDDRSLSIRQVLELYSVAATDAAQTEAAINFNSLDVQRAGITERAAIPTFSNQYPITSNSTPHTASFTEYMPGTTYAVNAMWSINPFEEDTIDDDE